MKCSTRTCKNTRDVCPISKLCPACDSWWKEYSKRQTNQDRQRHARDHSHNSNRNLNSPSSASSSEISTNPGIPSVQQPGVSHQLPSQALPSIDMGSVLSSYNQLKTNGSESPAMLNMYALMINIHSRQSEIDILKSDLNQTNRRLEAVEAKIGGPEDISERLGLVVRKLPLPSPGQTDLDLVKMLFAEIKIPGFDLNREVVKAVRKLPARPPPNISQPLLGSVLVEMKSEDSRTKIMKNKHVLEKHTNIHVKGAIIKKYEGQRPNACGKSW